MTSPERKKEADRQTALRSNQNLLLQNIKAVLANGNSFAEKSGIISGDLSSPTFTDARGGLPATQEQINTARDTAGGYFETLYDEKGRPYNVDPYVAAYYGSPELLTTRLVNPPRMSDFVHAKPQQLSILQPLLKFFMIDNQGNEKEIFFSDYVTEQKSLELSSLRRTGGVEDVLKPRSQKGTNVGIKSFQWNYNNKHEGDRIIKADLELYFGSVAELSNINYLQFLFTNGRKNPIYPDLTDDQATQNLYNRQVALQNEINAILKDYPERIEENNFTYLDLDSDDGFVPKDDFRQLKVAVGWAVPKGSQQKLLRMFTGSSDERRTKLQNFLASVRGTQRIITLGLVDYQVNFSQEGPTTLSITYMGSADNYLAQITSDIFGQFNDRLNSNHQVVPFSKEEFPESLKGAINNGDYMPGGYVAKLTEALRGVRDATAIGMSYAGLLFEERLLRKQQALKVLESQDTAWANHVGQQTINNSIQKISRQLAVVEQLIDLYLKKTESQRFAALFATLVQSKNLNSLDISTENGETKVSNSNVAVNPQDWQDAIRALFEAWTSNSSNQPLTLDDQGEADDGYRRIFYIKFGDILKTACTLAGLRKDIKFIVGSIDIDPYQAGASSASGQGASWVSIYDIPISVEYYMQLFFDRVISRRRAAYPMRMFVDDLTSLVSNILNNLTQYSLQTSLGMTVYTSYDFVQEKVLFPVQVESYQQRLSSNIYKKPGQSPKNHYIIYAKQMDPTDRVGDKAVDETAGIYHYAIGSDRGLAREFNFKKIDLPQYQAMQIEAANYNRAVVDRHVAASRALILPQDIEVVMFGNTLHRNGDMIYIDSRSALGDYANQILSLGGYYRVVQSTHKISPGEYTTTIQCKYELPTGKKNPYSRRQ